MQGYLLDTNIVSFWLHGGQPQHEAVLKRIAGLPDQAPLFVSAVTLGEIEYGHRLESPDAQTDFEQRFNREVAESCPTVLLVRPSTKTPYGLIRARLFRKFAPKTRRRRDRWPEELIDPTTAKSLGIQENDLWLAAQAIEHRLVFVTHDSLKRIREVSDELLSIEDWAEE